MKNLVKRAAALLLAAGMLLALAGVAAADSSVYVVTGTAIYRSADGLGEIGFANAGETLTVVGQTGNYYKISADNNGTTETGYVPKSACATSAAAAANPTATTTVTTTTTTPTTTTNMSSSADKTGVVAYGQVASGTKMYASDTTSSKVLGTFDVSGGVGIIHRTSTGYFYISASGGKGYVLSQSVYVDESNYTIPVVTSTTTSTVAEETKKIVAYASPAADTKLYSAPSTSATVLGTLHGGGSVGIISKSGDFYYISANNGYGYISTSTVYVSSTVTVPESAGAAVNVATSGGKTKTIANCKTAINFRAEANSTSTLLGTIAKGAKVSYLGKSGSYAKITYNGQTGYVLKKYVK